jgi:hypothetical protein
MEKPDATAASTQPVVRAVGVQFGAGICEGRRTQNGMTHAEHDTGRWGRCVCVGGGSGAASGALPVRGSLGDIVFCVL